MKYILFAMVVAVLLPAALRAQKGIDTQTQKIKDDSTKTSSRPTNTLRSIDWGKGKTRVRERLPNPYKMNSRRDVLLNTIASVLTDQKMIIDEASSRPGDGLIVTQPFVFAKGPVTTESEIKRYGVLEFGDNAWSRGRYSLTIEVQSIDGVQNNVSVNAKVEGRSGIGLTTAWMTVQSSGLAEDEFLAKLVEAVTGRSLSEPEPTDQ